MFWRVVGLRLEIEGAMLLVVMRQRSGKCDLDGAVEGFPTGKAVMMGADFSWVEEVTGRSGDQVNNTDGGSKVTVLNNISPDIDPFVLLCCSK